MMVDKNQDLSLGLNLSLNLMSPSFPFSTTIHHKSPWNHQPIPSSSSDQRTVRGIDVNRSLSLDREHSEEEAATSSPNSTVSSASGAKRGGRERDRDLQVSDEEDGDGSRKKLRLSKEQSLVLEESFKEHTTLNPKQKVALAKQLNLRPRQVEVWFQNRRARTKLKQTEVECELLKRCCENLKEENRRLQKEVQELRALKLSPQLYMHMTPPTTLTMCPSCERLTSSNSSSAAVATSAQQQQQQRPWAPIPMRANPFVSGGAAAAQRS